MSFPYIVSSAGGVFFWLASAEYSVSSSFWFCKMSGAGGERGREGAGKRKKRRGQAYFFSSSPPPPLPDSHILGRVF